MASTSIYGGPLLLLGLEPQLSQLPPSPPSKDTNLGREKSLDQVEDFSTNMGAQSAMPVEKPPHLSEGDNSTHKSKSSMVAITSMGYTVAVTWSSSEATRRRAGGHQLGRTDEHFDASNRRAGREAKKNTQCKAWGKRGARATLYYHALLHKHALSKEKIETKRRREMRRNASPKMWAPCSSPSSIFLSCSSHLHICDCPETIKT